MALILRGNIGLTESEMEALRFWGILNDIGKIAIPEYILNKLGPLSSEETEVMKSHPVA
jgi:HD-GYP domain-containing protein (c-di-GMP phosphodiesterase class II)